MSGLVGSGLSAIELWKLPVALPPGTSISNTFTVTEALRLKGDDTKTEREALDPAPTFTSNWVSGSGKGGVANCRNEALPPAPAGWLAMTRRKLRSLLVVF